MAVLLPNTALTIRRRTSGGTDAHGFPIQTDWDEPLTAHPARTKERGSGGWDIGLDIALWPVRVDDIVHEPATGREWLVVTADPIRNNYSPEVDWIRVDAAERVTGGTEPGGPEFTGRSA